ncbi:MAG: Mur ligase family protein, partial [bacterium]
WENLFKAKSKLITRHLKKEGIAVLNIDDKSYDGLSKLTSNFVIYSQENLEQERRAAWMIDLVTGSGLSYNLGLNFDNTSIRNVKVELDLIGDYNISNSLAAISACFLLDVDPHNSAKALSSFQTVEGRMQVLQFQPYRVIVDFAHTPNALQNALSSVKKDTKGKLIVVFGCAGQRDKHKRFEMGKIAGELADVTVITAEDPRTEKLSDINDEIERGWKSVNQNEKEFYRFDNENELTDSRLNAIKKALELVKPGDTVIITGKGHEESLCFGNTEYPWNDIVETKKLLK